MKKNELGLPSVIWMGFSFIAGITFTASFTAIVAQNQFEEKGVGIHILWIFLLEGLIAFLCAWAFAKLVKVHPQANGGGSQYARTAFGKFWGLSMGVLNYATIPLIAMSLFVTMIRTNFGDGAPNGANLVGENGSWGKWGNLYLDLIAFSLFLVAASIIYFGVNKYKIVATIIGYMTWTVTVLIMGFAIFSFIENMNKGDNGLANYTENANLNFKTFSNAFTTCFFAFAGIETFISTGNNIKDRHKTMPIAIIVIMILTTLFYIVFTIVLMGAVTDGFGSNPNMQVFPGKTKEAGGWLIIICTLLMRFNSSLQVTMFAGSTLQPLAKQHFIPHFMSRTNKEDVPIAGVTASIVIFGVTSFCFLFIPDIIQGVTGKASPFDYSSLAGTTSILLISIYMLAIPIALTQGFRKKMHVNVVEYIGWIITLLFLTFIMVSYFYDLFANFSKKDEFGNKDIQKIVGSSIQLIYFFAVILTAVCLFYVYHSKKIKDVENDPTLKAELEEYEKVFIINPINETSNKKKVQKTD